MKHYVTLLDKIYDRENKIYLGKGAILLLNLASSPMIQAIRKQYLNQPESMLITQRGKRFLFEFDGLKVE